MYLYNNNGSRRSHISMNAKMSYDKCMRYLDWISDRNFIVIEKNMKSGIVLVKLTESGMNFYQHVINVKDLKEV